MTSLFSCSWSKKCQFPACTLHDTHLHIPSPPALCHSTISSFLQSSIKSRKWVYLCKYGACQVHKVWGAALSQLECSTKQCCLQAEKDVLNVACWNKYHTVSSFAHFIECAATQNLNMGLMPAAVFFPSLPTSGFSWFQCPAVLLLLFLCYRSSCSVLFIA